MFLVASLTVVNVNVGENSMFAFAFSIHFFPLILNSRFRFNFLSELCWSLFCFVLDYCCGWWRHLGRLFSLSLSLHRFDWINRLLVCVCAGEIQFDWDLEECLGPNSSIHKIQWWWWSRVSPLVREANRNILFCFFHSIQSVK